MTQSDVPCPGIKTSKDKDGLPIEHFLHIIDESTGKLFCKESSCMYCYRDEHMNDIWRSDFSLLNIPT